MSILKLYDTVRQTLTDPVSDRQPLLAPSFTSAEHSSPRPRLRGGVGGGGESKQDSASNPSPLTWAPGRIEGPHQLVSGAGLSALISGPLPASSTSTRPHDLAAALHVPTLLFPVCVFAERFEEARRVCVCLCVLDKDIQAVCVCVCVCVDADVCYGVCDGCCMALLSLLPPTDVSAGVSWS